MAEGDNRQSADILVPAKDPERKDGDKPKSSANGKLKDEKDEPEIVGTGLGIRHAAWQQLGVGS